MPKAIFYLLKGDYHIALRKKTIPFSIFEGVVTMVRPLPFRESGNMSCSLNS